MKAFARLLSLALLLSPLAGCLQIDTLVSVRADGSGTVREQVRLSAEAVEMLRQTETMAAKAGAGSSGGTLIDRGTLEARAGAMGPGVKLESVRQLPGSGGYGYEAVWSFSDVNTLRVEQDAEGAMAQGAAAGEDAAKPAASFRLEPGTPAVLHVRSNLAGDAAGAPVPEPGESSQVPPDVVREMFSGLRFRIDLEVEGAIVETNASYREGSRVTLFALDFDRLLENPKALALLAATDAPDPMRMKDAMRGMPGLQVETEPDLRIAFAPAGAAGAALAGAAPAAAPEPPASPPAAAPEPPAAPPAPPPAPSPEMAAVPPAPAPAAASPTPAGSIAGYSWRAIDVADLVGQRLKLVAVTGAGGAVTKGMVITVDADSVRILRASMDGGGTVDVPLDTVRAASVFEQAP